MKYVGSKNRISKELSPIIQSFITDETLYYIEPFVGGCNMIDKINHSSKIGFDVHSELIALLKFVSISGNLSLVPKQISEGEYISVKDNKHLYKEWYIGLVGFCATFGSKYFGGYARGFKSDNVTPRNMSNEAIRNLLKQSEKLSDIYLEKKSFFDICIDRYDNCVFYIDPPYKGTLKYKTDSFNYDNFYRKCIELSKKNTILISEYYMPEELFECIWAKEHKSSLKIDNHKSTIEKLFIVRGKNDNNKMLYMQR